MKINLHTRIKAKDGILLVPVFSDELENLKNLPDIYPDFVKEFITKRVKNNEFKAKKGEIISTYLEEKSLPEKLTIVGFGEREKYKSLTARTVGAKIGKYLRKEKKDSLSFILQKDLYKYWRELFEGGEMAQHRIDKYKTPEKDEDNHYELKTLDLIAETKNKKLLEEIKKAELLSSGVAYVKNLVNSPSNEIDADYFEKEGRKLARKNRYKVAVFRNKELKKMGWGGLLAVNQGSDKDARCVVLEYRGGNRKDKPIVIVGKGVIFDTGGYNLKPTRFIETMHQDMAGAATVMGLFNILRKLGIKKNVVGIIPLAENLISAKAYKPSDVITMLSGKTVEITNTDAEGRLLLADGMTYADNFKPQNIITIATLTGAVSVALGNRYAGLMGNDLKLRKDLQKAGKAVDDLGWPLPIHPDFKKKLDSKVADMMNCNISNRGAGAQEGAAFLERFVGKNKWCHIDIGGTAFTDSPKEYEQTGATASGLRMLVQYLES